MRFDIFYVTSKKKKKKKKKRETNGDGVLVPALQKESKRHSIRREAFMWAALRSASFLGYPEGWASLAERTAPRPPPADETQLLSSGCEVIFLLIHQVRHV